MTGETTHNLRGDYSGMRPDCTVEQAWSAYSREEHALWRRLYARQAALVPKYACVEFIDSLAALDFGEAIPRFDAVNLRLARATGWEIVAVPGLVPGALAASPGASTQLRSAAARGDAQAQYDLAAAYACGRGVRADAAQAAQWFRKAAEQGHVQSMSVLGWMYMAGRGLARDDARALEWLTKAAEQGDTSAQNNLGIVYAQGRGVAPDRERAQQWFARAAEQGAEEASRNLASLRDGKRAVSGPDAPLRDVRI